MSNEYQSNYYPAKVLIAGEYSVVMGGEALAVPFFNFGATWKKSNWNNASLLIPFYDYLKGKNVSFLDLDIFFNDLMMGWYLDSNIPQGKGLGSSASLVSAIYSKYKTELDQDLQKLNERFALMESFFHGKSSGFDPLVVYMRSIICKQQGSITEMKSENMDLSKIFLFDSGIPRDVDISIPLVIDHLDRIGSVKYIALQNTLIRQLKYAGSLESSFKEVSVFQINYLSHLIPNVLKELWQTGIDKGAFYLKLCGAGGGGYYLCYVVNQEYMAEIPLELIPIHIRLS